MINDWIEQEPTEDDEQIEVECDGCGKVFPYDSLYVTMNGYCCLSCFDDCLYNFNEEDYDEE